MTTKVNNRMIDGSSINVFDFGAVGDGITNDTLPIQAACNIGGEVILDGRFLITSPIVVSVDKTTLRMRSGAAIINTVETQDAITITGKDCNIVGGEIVSPAVFNGANVGITYGVVSILGDGFTARDTKLINVPKSGFRFSKINDGRVVDCTIEGGTDSSFFTGANTVHFGISIDTPSTGAQGNFVISGNIIRNCVQGAGSGSTGSLTFEQAMSITGNVFEECWNHGWYSSGIANGHTITGNAFNACQIPIAVTGHNHVITGNTLTVQTIGSGLDTDNEITGISLRDPQNCVVSNNTIKGEGTPGGVVIGLDDNAGVPSADNRVMRNIVDGNTIHITNVDVGGVVAIRVLGNLSDVKDNIVTNNVIVAPARATEALIVVQGSAVATSYGNLVANNRVSMSGARGSSGFVQMINVSNSTVSNNVLSLEMGAPAFQAHEMISLNGNKIDVTNNKLLCIEGFGTNISLRGITEAVGASKNNIFDNEIYLISTDLDSHFDFLLQTTSDSAVKHSSDYTPEGVVVAGLGSMWLNRAGGAGNTLFVKESGTSNTGWVAK